MGQVSVSWHTTKSLDGFMAGPNHAMAWVFEYPSSSAAAEGMHHTAAIALASRLTRA